MKGPALFRTSLAARLALVFGLASLLVVSTMGLAIYGLTARYLESQAIDDLTALADFYAVYAASTAPDEAHLSALAPQIARFFAPQAGYVVRFFGVRTGDLLGATHDIGPLPSSAALRALGHRRPSLFLAASQDHANRLYAVRPVVRADGTVMAVVEVSRDTGQAQAFLGVLRLVLAGAGALALVAALVVSLLLARQVARPLLQMEAATQDIASGDLSRRLTITSEDEIGRLGMSINCMAADLARLEAARREFIAKISHDLRTPLTAIKGFVVNLQDTAPDELQATLSTMDEQTERLIRLVNELLLLSRLQRGELRLRRARTDLASLARSAASLVEQKARRLGVSLSLDLARHLTAVYGDADRLQQVVVNLLDNALKFTPAGGSVLLKVEAGDGRVTLLVLDSGRGVGDEELVHAFEPYYRGLGGGAGLGLTIAREIVTAHDGQIWLKARPEGGAEAGFWLPAAPVEEPRGDSG
jgi:signal transduction histidine kinase